MLAIGSMSNENRGDNTPGSFLIILVVFNLKRLTEVMG
jgi:hypothetical protein